MYLIQILLPLYDNEGTPFAQEQYNLVRNELTEQFGGLTAYVRSPATGLWKETDGATIRDDIIIYEVMVDRLNQEWWQSYRQELADRFRQETLIVRASEMLLL